jgi:hypothetical protein
MDKHKILADAKAELERHVWGTFVEGKATVAYARSICAWLGCHSVASRGIAEREERVGAATKRPQAWGPRKRPGEKSWLTDAARRYHSENATLFFDGADRRGLGGEPIAGSLLAARRGASRFQNERCSRQDACRTLIGNFLLGFQPVLSSRPGFSTASRSSSPQLACCLSGICLFLALFLLSSVISA